MTLAEPTITSQANPRVKAWLRLRDRAERDRTGLTLVDGAREVGRALDAGADIAEAIVGPAAGGMLARLVGAGIPVVHVSDAVLTRLAFGDRAEGVVAVVRVPDLPLERLAPPADALVVVLEGIEKPGNLGAVLRSADAAGVDALVVADPLTDIYNPNAIRASLGTIFHVPLAAAPSPEVLAWCGARAIRPVAARVDADRSYVDADLTGPVAIVLGSEADGLTASWRDPDVEAVHLPMRGVADSLNVSAAAAVLLFEARRQREAAR
jgi:TrmH family RNA methyltransferase